MSKIDDFAKQFEDAVRAAFVQAYGRPSNPDALRSIRSTWSEESVKQGWKDPDPRVVLIGSEYGWVRDPWSTDDEDNQQKAWAMAMEILKEDGWGDVAWESINAGVHYVYIMLPKEWDQILFKRAQDRRR
jgi:hypothetical protein